MTAICRRLIRPGGAWYGILRRTLTTLLGVKAKTKGCDACISYGRAEDAWEGRGCIRFQRTGRMIICLSGVCSRLRELRVCSGAYGAYGAYEWAGDGQGEGMDGQGEGRLEGTGRWKAASECTDPLPTECYRHNGNRKESCLGWVKLRA